MQLKGERRQGENAASSHVFVLVFPIYLSLALSFFLRVDVEVALAGCGAISKSTQVGLLGNSLFSVTTKSSPPVRT